VTYCADPRNHRKEFWWTDPGGFEWFDYRRKKIVPTRTALVRCQKCHRHWGTTNRELVASLPTRRPVCARHDWFYYSETRRICNVCGAIENRTL
jgi:hypothetical protein